MERKEGVFRSLHLMSVLHPVDALVAHQKTAKAWQDTAADSHDSKWDGSGQLLKAAEAKFASSKQNAKGGLTPTKRTTSFANDGVDRREQSPLSANEADGKSTLPHSGSHITSTAFRLTGSPMSMEQLSAANSWLVQ